MALLDRVQQWWERRAPEAKAAPVWPDSNIVYVPPLIHGPGATEILAGKRLDGNSAVFACLLALAEGFCEAPARVYRRTGPKDLEPQDTHPLQRLLDRPNPVMSPLELWGWVQWAKHLDGNAYVVKRRTGNADRGLPVELWPISPSRIELRSSETEYISAYRYHYAAGRYEDILPANMLHFRLGIDDTDMRKGLSPLRRLLRSCATDERISQWTDALLANGAIPGLVAQVKGNLGPADAEQLKAKLRSLFGGDNRGDVGVLDNEATLAQFGFNPEQMKLDGLAKLPEERISAVLRVPAIVAGLGAGLDRSTFHNTGEAWESFTEHTLAPLWAMDAAKLNSQLVPDFTTDRSTLVAFDQDQVRALQQDEDALAKRIQGDLTSGAITVDEARSALGYDPLDGEAGNVFYVPVNVTVTPAAELGAPPEPVPASNPADNLRALPAAASRTDREAKARGLSVPFARLRQRTEPRLTRAMSDFLAEQRARVLERLGATDAAAHWETKAAEDLVPFTEDVDLRRLLEPFYVEILTETQRAVQAALGVAFDVPDYAALQYLRTAGQQITAINETTRSAVRAALLAGTQEGEGIDAIARRIRSVTEFNAPRARTVARTELGNAQLEASFTTYRQSGVVEGVRVLDGDYDEECANRNGQVFSLAAAHTEPRLLHPNCTAAWLPVVDAKEIEGAA